MLQPQGTPRNRGEKRQKLVESEETFDNFITPPKEILEESNNESEDEESESEGSRRKSLVARRLFIDLEEPEVQKQEVRLAHSKGPHLKDESTTVWRNAHQLSSFGGLFAVSKQLRIEVHTYELMRSIGGKLGNLYM